MVFDERQILLNGESVCEEVCKCQHEETKKCTFLLKALLCLASDTWVFSEVRCLDTDIYLRPWLGSLLGWTWWSAISWIIQIGCWRWDVHPSRKRVKCHACARACILQQVSWNSAWQISSFPQPLQLLPGVHRVPWHGRQVPGHCYSSTNLSDSVQSHLQGPFAARDVNEQGLQLHIASAEMFVQSTHVAKQATTWKGSSLSSLTDCISSLFDDCTGLLTQKSFQGELLLPPSSTCCKDISPPLLQGMLRREPQR